MKYIIQKGFRGFGDRLKNLLLCVKIAIQSNRKIYVDWSDHYWNHNGENFYTYFELLDVGIDKLESIDNIQKLTVYPPFWNDKLNIPLTKYNFYDGQKNKISSLSKIIKKYPDDDIIVITNRSHSTFVNFLFFAEKFRVRDTRILNRVKELQNKHNLKECVGIHLRGTDRNYENRSTERIVSELIGKYSYNINKHNKIVCFTDDVELYNEFKKSFPTAVLITQVLIPAENPSWGTHVIPSNYLKHTKDQMNVDLISDFFTLASCKEAYSTCEDSLFFQLSRNLHPYVNMILGNG